MKNGYLTNFFFTGLGILPVLVAFGGHLDIATMLLFPLLIAAMLSGMDEHGHEQAAETAANDPEYGYADAAGHDIVVPFQAKSYR